MEPSTSSVTPAHLHSSTFTKRYVPNRFFLTVDEKGNVFETEEFFDDESGEFKRLEKGLIYTAKEEYTNEKRKEVNSFFKTCELCRESIDTPCSDIPNIPKRGTNLYLTQDLVDYLFSIIK